MDHYIDISILLDPEFSAPVLMNVVYSRLHQAVCDHQSTSMGIRVPKYNVTLGNVLRIHGNKKKLLELQELGWFVGMSSYCAISSVLLVPVNTKFRTVSRLQPTMSQAKLRRLIKREALSEAEVSQYKAKMFSKGLDNPYVELVSGSNGQKHRRYIKFGDLRDQSVSGEFDQFGLSKTATVPWFD